MNKEIWSMVLIKAKDYGIPINMIRNAYLRGKFKNKDYIEYELSQMIRHIKTEYADATRLDRFVEFMTMAGLSAGQAYGLWYKEVYEKKRQIGAEELRQYVKKIYRILPDEFFNEPKLVERKNAQTALKQAVDQIVQEIHSYEQSEMPF